MTFISKDKYYLKPKGARSIHIKGNDDPDKEVASEIVLHFLESGDLLFELFPHNETIKATGVGYIQFNISLAENPDLMEFWVDDEHIDIATENKRIFMETMEKTNPEAYKRMIETENSKTK